MKITEEKKWYKEFCDLYQEIKEYINIIDSMQNDIRQKFKNKFLDLENIFNKKNNKELIIFILENYPYKEYEDNKKQKK